MADDEEKEKDQDRGPQPAGVQDAAALVPAEVIKRFLAGHVPHRLICAAVAGPHAGGYAEPACPLELKALHVEPTENLVGLIQAPKAFNWVGEHEGQPVDFSSTEIGQACHLLLRGDGSILERILAPRQVLGGEDLQRLQRVARGAICRSFYNHYRTFSRGVLQDFEGQPPRNARRVLNAYRVGLTGVELLRSGRLELDLTTLAHAHGFSRLDELLGTYRARGNFDMEEGSPWINRLARIHALLDAAYEASSLPVDPENPADVEDYLLDMRRRFFDAYTVQA